MNQSKKIVTMTKSESIFAREDLTNQYAITKTSKFALIPMGKTQENLDKDGVVAKDVKRSEKKADLKDIISRLHINYIEKKMFGAVVSSSLLTDYEKLYNISEKEKTPEDKLKIKKIEEKLRQEIVSYFKAAKINGNVSMKENSSNPMDLIKSHKDLLQGKKLYEIFLPMVTRNQEELDLVDYFHGFTTSLRRHNEMLQNLYSDEEKKGTIAYRIINENLPMYIENMKIFQMIREKVPTLLEKVEQIDSDFRDKVFHVVDYSSEEIFGLESFCKTFSQTGITEYNYLIGGFSDERFKKTKGFNELINEYNQTVENKKDKIPYFHQLFKQILSEKDDTIKEEIPRLEKDDDIFKIAEDNYKNYIAVKKELTNFLDNFGSYNPSGIYLRGRSLNSLSYRLYSGENKGRYLKNAIFQYYEDFYEGPINNKSSYFTSLKDKSVSIADINKMNHAYIERNEIEDVKFETVEGYYITTLRLLMKEVDSKYEIFHEMLDLDSREYAEKDIRNKNRAARAMQDYFRAYINLRRVFLLLQGLKTESDKDVMFYQEYESILESINELTSYYRSVDQYMVRKPYSTKKIKLSFENYNLAAGWNEDKEATNGTIIFEKDGNYFLGVVNKKEKDMVKTMHSELVGAGEEEPGVEYFNKLSMNTLKSRSFTYMFIKDAYLVSDEIKEIVESCEHIKNPTKDQREKAGDKFKPYKVESAQKVIDFMKDCLHGGYNDKQKNYYDIYNLKFSDTSTYTCMNDFYKEAEDQLQSIEWKRMKISDIKKYVDNGSLYLFQIYCKDFSKHAKGKKDLNTLYFLELFTKENFERPRYLLRGDAEIFFRKASIPKDKATVHKAGVPIKNKRENYPKKESIYGFDIIKDRRFTKDQYELHLPILINAHPEKNVVLSGKINEIVKNEEVNVLGIDRGERNLLYISLLNPQGEILYQSTLNIIPDNNPMNLKTDHHKLIAKKITAIKKGQGWGNKRGIKDTTNAYLGQAAAFIAKFALKNDAVIVMEKLSKTFFNNRSCVEHSLYQQFETKLLNKLNCFVNKDFGVDEIGGVKKPLQLANQFVSLEKVGNQSGIVYYVDPWNTSSMDPTTGFMNLIKTSYESVKDSKNFFNKFDAIRYNAKEDYFEFDVDYSKFSDDVKKKDNIKWTICSFGERIIVKKNNNNKPVNQTVCPTEELKKLLAEYGIDYHADNLKEMIANGEMKKPSKFYPLMMNRLKTVLQLRNSEIGSNVDYILSCVKNANGEFFDTRLVNDNTLPIDADGNGAFNIARKGICFLHAVETTPDDELHKRINFNMKRIDWVKYARKYSCIVNHDTKNKDAA